MLDRGSASVGGNVNSCVYVCVCVCVRERERESERKEKLVVRIPSKERLSLCSTKALH